MVGRSSSTLLPLRRSRPVGLPHDRVLQTHRPAAALLLRLVAVDVAHAHPASPAPRGPGRGGADGPLGVVRAAFEGELPQLDDSDVQDLPVAGAVGGQNAAGVNPKLDQEV